MIIQLIGSLRGGGAERVAITLHKAFKKLNIPSKVMVLSDKIDYKIDDNDIVINGNIKNLKADLIIAHMEDVSQKIDNKNVWHVIHNSYSFKFKEKNIISRLKHYYNFKKIYNNKNLICVSNGVKEDILNNLKIKPKTIKTIYNPLKKIF
jgi:hypothetical protein